MKAQDDDEYDNDEEDDELDEESWSEEDWVENAKDEILSESHIERAIFEAYKELPSDLRDALSFDTFYQFHRVRIATLLREAIQKAEDQKNRKRVEKFIEEGRFSSPPINIPQPEPQKKRICNKCKKDYMYLATGFDDPDFCNDCKEILKKQAQDRETQIQEELIIDPGFLKCKSIEQRNVYVSRKYSSERANNKFLYLSKIAKLAHALRQLNENSNKDN